MKLKGRQLGFLVLLCSGWAVARIALLSNPSGVVPYVAAVPTAPYLGRNEELPQQTAYPAASPIRSASSITKSVVRRPTFGSIAPVVRQRKPSFSRQPENTALANFLLSPSQPQPKASVERLVGQFDPVPALATAPSQRNPIAEIYAYSYWRWDTQSSGLAAAGQYGGSQSGLIAAFRVFNNGDNLAALVRAAIAPDSAADREVAIGLRWRPVRVLPVTLTAERRFRPVGPDRSAVYLAGGVDDIKLPARLGLDSYAQGGFVSGRGAGWFFDASARAYRSVYNATAFSARIGGGAWAGGQRGASRLDVGPSIATDISIAGERLRVSGDWRFRIAGDAHPDNGPALTLSTSF